jgi:adenine-specific DNA methylase
VPQIQYRKEDATMTDKPRLIEFAFPLKQASLDSVHEKNVRHGHISTLHIWPARRPLAACRAALIATLMPDPSAEPKPEGMSEDQWQKEIQRRRQELCEKIGGKVVKKIEKKKMPGGQTVERIKEETVGGILHWGRETENAETLQWFRDEIKKAYGGRAPKVLDPFAGGGAIPLEAMRLGCEATAIDINPVAWFILKCTLEYPQRLAGQKRPLPDFILKNKDFMEAFLKSQRGTRGRGDTATRRRKNSPRLCVSESPRLFEEEPVPEADLAWHVRAWGQWVLDRARRELAQYYPTYADFEPLDKTVHAKSYERQPMQLVPLKDDGTPDVDALNHEFSAEYLANKKNPRWVAKPTVAYLWARTVTCKNCRATVPLLKTRWLCKKDRKRVLLTMEPNADKSGVVFGVETNVPVKGGNAAQRREHDKRLGAGTMSRAGVQCPCCSAINTMEDIRLEGKAGRLGSIMTAVVVDSPGGKDYRLPTDHELAVAALDEERVRAAFKEVPFGVPEEPTPAGGGSGAGRAFSVQGYGLMKWRDLFTPRQLVALGTFVAATRAARDAMAEQSIPAEWIEAVGAYLTCGFDRMLDFNASTLSWITSVEAIGHTFVRFALPMTWDFCEAAPINALRGGWDMCLGAVMESQPTLGTAGMATSYSPQVLKRSAVKGFDAEEYDAIVTDPPYYDAIPYSDLMDYFYIWQRRTLAGLSADIDAVHSEGLSSKWDREKNDGELIDDASRHDNDAAKSKQTYEDGMAQVFVQCAKALKPDGRLVIVFANKQPAAWETLVSAIIRAGFVIDGSWPIQTEQAARMRAQSSAALASSVWLVGKKRPESARPGWDNKVLEDIRANIGQRLRDFWDAGIRGPDFVWAATGPALEAYSKHPVVKMANDPGQTLSVSEFLNHARRMVVDFVVGRVLSKDEDNGGMAAADRLDEPTAYYLLHRNDFNLEDAPVGACILYATACGLSDQELIRDWDLLVKSGDAGARDEEDAETRGRRDAEIEEEEEETGSGSKVKLKAWNQRRGRSMGYEAPGGRPVPLIDRIHRLMHLWKGGDVHKVDEYLDEHGLRRHELFRRVLQSLIELAKRGSEERSLLESLSNHIGAKGAKRQEPKYVPMSGFDDED